MSLKKQWDEYLDKLHQAESMPLEEHIKMALKVGDLLRENERLERNVTKLGADWSKVVDEKNKYRESLEEIAHHIPTPLGMKEDYSDTVYEFIDIAKRCLGY